MLVNNIFKNSIHKKKIKQEIKKSMQVYNLKVIKMNLGTGVQVIVILNNELLKTTKTRIFLFLR